MGVAGEENDLGVLIQEGTHGGIEHAVSGIIQLPTALVCEHDDGHGGIFLCRRLHMGDQELLTAGVLGGTVAGRHADDMNAVHHRICIQIAHHAAVRSLAFLQEGLGLSAEADDTVPEILVVAHHRTHRGVILGILPQHTGKQCILRIISPVGQVSDDHQCIGMPEQGVDLLQ